MNHCLGQAIAVLNAAKEKGEELADAAIQELEILLSIPLSSLALQVPQRPSKAL